MFSAHDTPLLLVGPVTQDVHGDEVVPGGSVSYAARAAAALGVEARVLTVAAPDADLGALSEADTRVLAASSTLTFTHEPASAGRALKLLAWPDRRIAASDLPEDWRTPSTMLLAPLLPDDLVLLSFLALPCEHVVLLAQGVQRRIEPGGRIEHEAGPSDALLRCLAPHVSVFLSEQEVRLWPDASVARVAAGAARLVVTRGAEGATVYRGGSVLHIPAAASETVDTTGAGDVFAAAFAIAIGEGMDDAHAGALASALAAAAVERRGPAPLPPRAAIEERAHAVLAGVREGVTA